MPPIERLRARQRRFVWLALAVAICVGIFVRLVHFGDVTSRSPDERVYTDFASRIAQGGLSATHTLFAEYESDSDRWNYPSPTRIGHLLFVAAAMNISGVRDDRAGAAVSLAFSCLSLFLLAWIGVRFFNPTVALAAVAFAAFSVGELGMARRAWQDSPFGFFGLLAVYLTCEITRNPRRLSLYPAFLTVGAYCLLTKQTGIIPYGVCSLWLLGYLIFRVRSLKGAALLGVGGVASLAATVAVWSILAGSPSVALSALNHSLHPGVPGWSYLQACCTGPWYQFFYFLWIVGPLTAATALVGSAVSVFPWKFLQRIGAAGSISEPYAATVALLMTVSLFIFASLFPGMQCLRYVSPADGTYALLAGLGVWSLLSLSRAMMSRADYRLLLMLAVVAVVIEGARNYRTFTSVVVESGMRDLAVVDIRRVMER